MRTQKLQENYNYSSAGLMLMLPEFQMKCRLQKKIMGTIQVLNVLLTKKRVLMNGIENVMSKNDH